MSKKKCLDSIAICDTRCVFIYPEVFTNCCFRTFFSFLARLCSEKLLDCEQFFWSTCLAHHACRLSSFKETGKKLFTVKKVVKQLSIDRRKPSKILSSQHDVYLTNHSTENQIKLCRKLVFIYSWHNNGAMSQGCCCLRSFLC